MRIPRRWGGYWLRAMRHGHHLTLVADVVADHAVKSASAPFLAKAGVRCNPAP